MPNLFPANYEEEVVTIDDLRVYEPVGYKESVYFDEESGDLLRDGHYSIKGATGIEAWEQWCINCLMTERDKYPCYGHTFGIKTEEAFRSNDRDKTESILTREICESLENDPYGRTDYVSDVLFDWSQAPDSVAIMVKVKGVADVTIDITTVIDRRAR